MDGWMDGQTDRGAEVFTISLSLKYGDNYTAYADTIIPNCICPKF